ncbi:TIR domain-containing protein [Tahibacter sp.]|uniref:TIR domain-containing protein n=1 Tax=Tahibacter sp. TaxID=2056211 RepID=UPI0028C48B1F|nr:TIR domain-containing protein [Tahibacter sp.]
MIFISYSSADKNLGVLLQTWLGRRRFPQVFFDRDVVDGIALGAEFPRALRDAHQRSSTFLLLVTRSWLQSSYCQAEWKTALLAGKRLVPLLCEPGLQSMLPPEIAVLQGCDFTAALRPTVRRLAGFLAHDTLDRLASLDAYRRALARHVDAPTYDVVGSDQLGLLDWYVPLGARLRIPGSSDGLAIGERLFEAVATEQRVIVVEGPAGSGKSTLLKFLARCALDEPGRVGLSGSTLPLLLRLRDLAAVAEGRPETRLRRALENMPRFHLIGSAVPEDFLASWAAAADSEWLFLFDAFDEVPDALRKDVGLLIDALIEELPRARVVVATRRRDLVLAALGGHAAADVLLDAPDTAATMRIARRWIGESADSFRVQLEHGALEQLCDTALGVTMLAAVFPHVRSLPTSRSRLYQHYFDLLLSTAAKSGGSGQPPLGNAGVMTALLEAIALRSMNAGASLDERGCISCLAETLRRIDPAKSETGAMIEAKACLHPLMERSGVFAGPFEWRHQTFCDFLAAGALSRGTEGPDTAFVERAKRAPGTRWEGVIGFALASWTQGFDADDDAPWERLRPVFEAFIGARPQYRWWQRLRFWKALPRDRASHLLPVEQIVALGDWLVEAGGAPHDVQDHCLAGLMRAKDAMGEQTLMLCATLFDDDPHAGVAQLRSLSKWRWQPRLRRSLASCIDTLLAELESTDGLAAAAVAGLLLRLGAAERIATLVGSPTRMLAWDSIAQALAESGNPSLIDTLGSALVAAAVAAKARLLNGLYLMSETLTLIRETGQQGFAKSSLGAWISANRHDPVALFARYCDASRNGDVAAGIAVLRDAKTDYRARMQRAVARAQRLGGSVHQIDLLFTFFDRSELQRRAADESLPTPLRILIAHHLGDEAADAAESTTQRFMTALLAMASVANAADAAPHRVLSNLLRREELPPRWFLEQLARCDLKTARAFIEEQSAQFDAYDAAAAAMTLPAHVEIVILEARYARAPLRSDEDIERRGKLRERLIGVYATHIAGQGGLAERVRRAELLFYADHLAEAEGECDTVLVAEPDHADARLVRARIREVRDSPSHALVDIDHVLRKEPGNGYAWYLRSFPLFALQRYREAALGCERGIAAGSGDLRLREQCARNRHALGELDAAIEQLTLRLDEEPWDLDLRFLRARYWSDAGKVAESRDDLQLSRGARHSRDDRQLIGVQNRLAAGQVAAAARYLRRAPPSWERGWLSCVALFVLRAGRTAITDRLAEIERKGAEPEPADFGDDGTVAFWLDVLRDQESAARGHVERWKNRGFEGNLRWLSIDLAGLPGPFPDWVWPLVLEAAAAAESIREHFDAQLPEPSPPEPEPIAAPTDRTPVLRRKALYVNGMLCQLAGIAGYDEERELAAGILVSTPRRALVIMPLHDTGFVYIQANVRYAPEADHDFKITMDFRDARAHGVLRDTVLRTGIEKVFVTCAILQRALEKSAHLKSLRAMLELVPRSLPYSPSEVIFERVS